MRQLSTKVQMKWMLAIIGNRTAFKNEKNPYRMGIKFPLNEVLKKNITKKDYSNNINQIVAALHFNK